MSGTLPALLALAVLLLGAAKCSSITEESQDVVLHSILHDETNRHLQQLATISDSPDVLVRTFMSPAHKQAAVQIRSWMADAGMDAHVDAVGNVYGKLGAGGPVAGKPALLLGSHYDTVLDAGKYDGALGILTAISAVKALVARRLLELGREVARSAEDGDVRIDEHDAETLFAVPIHVVAFADEEGLRFKTTFLGSRALVSRVVIARITRATMTLFGGQSAEVGARTSVEPSQGAQRDVLLDNRLQQIPIITKTQRTCTSFQCFLTHLIVHDIRRWRWAMLDFDPFPLLSSPPPPPPLS